MLQLWSYDPHHRAIQKQQKCIGLLGSLNYFRSVKYFKIIIGLSLLVSSLFASATLTGLAGYPDDARIIIQWNTTVEQGVAGFEIQRSTDGRNFFEIGYLHAQGQGSSYTFIDDSIIAKVSGRDYTYRLKIRNTDGSSEISDVITIESNLSPANHTWGSLKALFK